MLGAFFADFADILMGHAPAMAAKRNGTSQIDELKAIGAIIITRTI